MSKDEIPRIDTLTRMLGDFERYTIPMGVTLNMVAAFDLFLFLCFLESGYPPGFHGHCLRLICCEATGVSFWVLWRLSMVVGEYRLWRDRLNRLYAEWRKNGVPEDE